MWIDKLTDINSINKIMRERSQKFRVKNIETELLEKYRNEGWEIDRELKRGYKVKKLKSSDEMFENEVWILFKKMGYNIMNTDRNFRVPYNEKGDLTHQIDVFASDEDTIIIIECKCANKSRKESFKKEINEIAKLRENLNSVFRKEFGHKKIKYILATKNYTLTDFDIKRLEEEKIIHFDENKLSYYQALGKHLGSAAKYQLLGHIFQKTKIENLNLQVPAIKGKMGNKEYYSFSIEPEKLLKIAYVLHRNDANLDMLPTYQRIIKKNRLEKIKDFVENGGYFPNSLIINIEGSPNFKKASLKLEDTSTQIGILELPKLYKSAYIIDGQHRLYGYSESKFGNKDVIPVVAFYNLEEEEQLKIFMEINENQKSVPKNLQNTLNADLEWSSKNNQKRIKALRLKVAIELGENSKSPLYQNIQVGENEKSGTNYIKIESINEALDKSKFFNKYNNKNSLVETGFFDKGNNSETKNYFMPILIEYLSYIKEESKKEWDKFDKGLVTSNIGIYAIIRIFSDIVDYIVKLENVSTLSLNTSFIRNKVKVYLDHLISFINDMDENTRLKLRTNYGGKAKIILWRTFQKAIFDSCTNFKPEGLEEWMKNSLQQYNKESYEMLNYIYDYMNEMVKRELINSLGEESRYAIPKNLYLQLTQRAHKENYDNPESNITFWDCITLEEMQMIIGYRSNWSNIFEKKFKEIVSYGKNKNDSTQWMVQLSKIKDKQKDKNYSVIESDYIKIKEIYNSLKGIAFNKLTKF